MNGAGSSPAACCRLSTPSAATAKIHRMTLVTRNTADIADLDVQVFQSLRAQISYSRKSLAPASRAYTVHVNGPWCITFEFDAGDALRVDFAQYH